MNFPEIREECDSHGIVKNDMGVNVCGASRGVLCCEASCPSIGYWTNHRDFGYGKMKALERTGLVDDYEEEMG